MNADELRTELELSVYSFASVPKHMLHDNWERLLNYWMKMPDDIRPTLESQRNYYFMLAYDQLLYLDFSQDLSRPFASQVMQTSCISILKVRILELQIVHLLLLSEDVMMAGTNAEIFLLCLSVYKLRVHLHDGHVKYLKASKGPKVKRPPYPAEPFQSWSRKELAKYGMQQIDYLADYYRHDVDDLMQSQSTNKEFIQTFMKLSTMLIRYMNICVIQNR